MGDLKELADNKQADVQLGKPIFRDQLASFREASGIESIPYEAHGITNIEAFYWWALVGHYRPDVILESGVANGRSTQVLSRAQRHFGVPYHFAFDTNGATFEAVKHKLGPKSETHLIAGDAASYIASLHKHEALRTVASGDRALGKLRVLAIIDGPKAGEALEDLYFRLARLNLVAVGVHDCNPSHSCGDTLQSMHAKYWPRAGLVFTDEQVNVDLWRLNDCVRDDIKLASERARHKYSRKTGVEVTPEVYERWIATVGLLLVE